MNRYTVSTPAGVAYILLAASLAEAAAEADKLCRNYAGSITVAPLENP